MRKFDPGSLRLIDDERFELVSVWIPQVGASGTFEIGRNGVESRYSSGPSAFPEEACVASATVGTLEVEPREDSVQVKMSLWVEFGGQGAKRAECPDLYLIDSGAYRVETIDGLTPWLGGPFERLYDATYRK